MYDISQVQSEYKTKLIDADFAASLVKSNYLLKATTGCTSAWEQGAPFTWTEPLASASRPIHSFAD